MSEYDWHDGPINSTMTSGPWFVSADGCGYAILLDGIGQVRFGQRSNRDDSKRAAEAALRALGVQFRVEGES
jgi:hypothetical protein